MVKSSKAPDISPGYPSKGKKVGPAWDQVWAELQREDWLDGHVLAEQVAPLHGLAKMTVVALISRAATAGILERRPESVISGRGSRGRSHYKIIDKGKWA